MIIKNEKAHRRYLDTLKCISIKTESVYFDDKEGKDLIEIMVMKRVSGRSFKFPFLAKWYLNGKLTDIIEFVSEKRAIDNMDFHVADMILNRQGHRRDVNHGTVT